MTLRIKVRYAAFLAALLVTLVVVVGGIQNAALAVGACSNGYVCGWQHANWSGTKVSMYRSFAFQCANISAANDNTWSSWVNRSGVFAQLRSDDTCGGLWVGGPNGYSDNDLNNSGMNDNAESVKFSG